MTKLTDEMLVAYVDGTLDPTEREHVETLLKEDSEARDRLEGFRITGRLLAELMDRHMPSPSPKRLLDRVLPEETKPGPAIYERYKQQSAGVAEKLGAHLYMVPLFAAVMIAGVGLGWFLNSNGVTEKPIRNNFVHIESNRMYASAKLQNALETLPSSDGTTAAIANNNPKDNSNHINIRMTFRNKEGHYCREYEVGDKETIRNSGVACRNGGGDWFVHVQALIAPAPSIHMYIPAGTSRNTMDIVALSLMEGAPLAKNEEVAAIADGWRK
ncbi:MAG: hypothetical protein P8Y67_01260 [Alphaproteobacteria bacterium]